MPAITPQVQTDTSPPSPHVSKRYDKLEHICSFLADPAQLCDLQLSECEKFVKHVRRFFLRNGQL